LGAARLLYRLLALCALRMRRLRLLTTTQVVTLSHASVNVKRDELAVRVTHGSAFPYQSEVRSIHGSTYGTTVHG
jgi:hypothetical protein